MEMKGAELYKITRKQNFVRNIGSVFRIFKQK
jgi:hypothetical protein